MRQNLGLENDAGPKCHIIAQSRKLLNVFFFVYFIFILFFWSSAISGGRWPREESQFKIARGPNFQLPVLNPARVAVGMLAFT